MAATNVPWPRPSPAAFGWIEVRLTWATTRPPKSDRLAWIPESTTAIAGAFAAAAVFQTPWKPATYGQRCELV